MTRSDEHGIRSALDLLPEIIGDIQAQTSIAVITTDLLPGGEQGAMRVVDSSGNPYILKVHRGAVLLDQYRSAAHLVNRLRETHYPAPEYVATGSVSGWSWVLIESLPGEPSLPLTSTMLKQLIDLNQAHRNKMPNAPNHNWIREIADSILKGYDTWCIVDSLQGYSPATASILRQIQEIAGQYQYIEVTGDDIVHFDFHPANVLSIDDQITGVIDWDGCRIGDASFDLATMLFYCYDVERHRKVLLSEIVHRSGRGALRLYLAHMILRQLDWSIRHHDDATAIFFIDRAEHILDTLDTHAGTREGTSQ